MSNELYTRNRKYYIIEDVRDGIYGPFNLKDAINWQLNSSFRCIIAKVVINEDGEEVK